MKFKDYYKTMALTSEATQEEIKQAYHRLAHKFHPDISKESDAKQRLKEINEAYEVLKDSQKRSTYDTRFKSILPVPYVWFRTKKEAWKRTHTQKRAKREIQMHTNFFGNSKKSFQKFKIIRMHTLENKKNKTNKNIFLMRIVGALLIFLVIIVASYFSLQYFNKWQDRQQLIAAILQHDEAAIETLENSTVETQSKILENAEIKPVLVNFYIQRAERDILSQLDTFDETVETDILMDKEVYRILKAHYYQKIDSEVRTDSFEAAFQWLEQLENKYPSFSELSDKHEEIQNEKQQRLAELTQQYMECLDQTLAPLLERTHCMAKARQQIENVGIEHTLPMDPNLPAMYTEEIQHAFLEKNYEQVEKLLLDWENLLPSPSEQRDKLKQNLALHRQVKDIIVDLTESDHGKIVNRLHQLTADDALQKELFEMPKVQNGLLRYHLNEALALIETSKDEIKINSRTKARLKQLLAQKPGERTQPKTSSTAVATKSESKRKSESKSSSSPTRDSLANLLQECQKHYQAKRLTTGQPGTALACYQRVLKQNPGNREALKGLKAIENRYRIWAENALQQNKFDKAKTYLAGLKRVNPNSSLLRKLTGRLRNAMRQPKPTPKRKTPVVKVPAVKVVERQSPTPKPIPKPVVRQPPTQNCKNCNCSELLKQLSLGIKPLTSEQKTFFQNRCR